MGVFLYEQYTGIQQEASYPGNWAIVDTSTIGSGARPDIAVGYVGKTKTEKKDATKLALQLEGKTALVCRSNQAHGEVGVDTLPLVEPWLAFHRN